MIWNFPYVTFGDIGATPTFPARLLDFYVLFELPYDEVIFYYLTWLRFTLLESLLTFVVKLLFFLSAKS